MDKNQRIIEKGDDIRLNFCIYDDLKLSNEDLDNVSVEDISPANQKIKIERESTFDKDKLPDSVFIKNRLIARDIQEHYLFYLLEDNNFNTFKGLISHKNNIKYFLENTVINSILDSLVDVNIINGKVKGLYYGVVSNYSISRFRGLMDYQISKGITDLDKDINKAYMEAFGQVKSIIEFEIPRLLCLFEAIYQQAGRLKGFDMDGFNLSGIISFFELGVETALGIYLVEYGYPIDTIHLIEKTYITLKDLNLKEGIKFINDRINVLTKILDAYELKLLEQALETMHI